MNARSGKRKVKKYVNMMSGRERVYEYDVFLNQLSNSDQYASNFLNLLAV